VLSNIFTSHIHGLQATMELIEPDTLQLAVDKLSTASHIDFWGNGGSAALALDAYHKFFKTGISGAYHTDSHFQSMSACTMPTGSVLVAISHSGSNKSLVELTQLAKDNGVFVIAISSSLSSPLSRVAHMTLATPSREVKVRSEATTSRIATLAMIDVLSIAVSLKHQERALSNLRQIREAISNQRMG
jgi:DNA-binding MurR/RpiR family transcriptional regulator